MEANTQRILNVDDYAPGLYARSKVLRQAGFDVVEACTGVQALKMVNELKPALVLLDVNLPDISGFDVCRKIKSNPQTGATTIVHVSASSIENQQVIHGLEGGADCYVVEPVDPAVLIATIRALLRAREAEDALRRSNADLERFAYMVTHELNEPLRTITMHTQLLAEHFKDNFDTAAGQSFGFIIDSSNRMRSFITDLLRYSQATHAGTDVRPLEMDSVVDQVILSLAAAIQGADVKITRDPLPVVTTDARIEHVLQNLIGNAIKYRRPDIPPEIHISAKEKDEAWVFCVRDNGIGIDPAYQKTIFHVFRRLHGHDVPGNGIGLAFAQKIVEGIGGTMWVESSPGVGSNFYFTVPNVESAVATD